MLNYFNNSQYSKFKNTIVTSFVCNSNNRKDRSIDKYIELGKVLLQTKIPKVIFMDEQIYDKFSEYFNEYNFFIKINQKDLYLNNYLDKITSFDINSTFKDKDTLNYFITICNKTEFIKRAILLNIFDTPNFIWVDFGIKHVFNCDNNEFIRHIENLNNKVYDNQLRVASIWNLQKKQEFDIYKDVTWYFAGGVFGGSKEKILWFAYKTKEMCLRVIEEKKTLLWEVNIWYLIYLENPDLITPYYCGHDPSIIIHF
jgi:hypothetical protein